MGAFTSFTVTIAVPVFTFPFTSVTVNVTVFGPIVEQLNEFGDTVLLAIPQSSLDPLFTSAAVIVATPAELRLTEMFCVITVGAVTSFTVTIAVPVFTFPFTSVTVNVTVLLPAFVQSK